MNPVTKMMNDVKSLPSYTLETIFFYSIRSALPSEILEDIVHYTYSVNSVLKCIDETRYSYLFDNITEILNEGIPIYLGISKKLECLAKRHRYVKELSRHGAKNHSFLPNLYSFFWPPKDSIDIRYQKVFSLLFISYPGCYDKKIRLIFSLLDISEREILVEKLQSILL